MVHWYCHNIRKTHLSNLQKYIGKNKNKTMYEYGFLNVYIRVGEARVPGYHCRMNLIQSFFLLPNVVIPHVTTRGQRTPTLSTQHSFRFRCRGLCQAPRVLTQQLQTMFLHFQPECLNQCITAFEILGIAAMHANINCFLFFLPTQEIWKRQRTLHQKPDLAVIEKRKEKREICLTKCCVSQKRRMKKEV